MTARTTMDTPRRAETATSVEDRPKDILDAAGRWLADELGWHWFKSRHDVETRQASQVLRLHLQPSKWNAKGSRSMGHLDASPHGSGSFLAPRASRSRTMRRSRFGVASDGSRTV